LAIPTKRVTSTTPRHLAADELAALLAASDPATVQGRHDHALLLFLVRTGARVSEAIGADERRPVFVGERGHRLTRFGVTHLVRRAVTRATVHVPALARIRVSPHLFRHTLAMQLLRARIDLVTIQAWLGHAQVATTHRYAEADVEMMRRSLEEADVTGAYTDRYCNRSGVPLPS
jgi:site-specific recombinase XerD